MTRPLFTTLAVPAICLGSACTSSEPLSPLTVGQPAFQQAPAAGQAKEIIAVDVELPGLIACANGTSLDVHVIGWIQLHAPTRADRAVTNYHLIFTFSNAAGETYVWQNVNSDHLYFDRNGDLIVAVTGRHGVSDPLHSGVIGRLVINLTNGTVVSDSGQNTDAGERACAALT
jgi:hypothetical protein